MKPYYYIFRVGGSHPRIKHPTLESAHTEAMRLAAQHPGDSFEILQCLATTRTTNPQTFWVDGVIPSPDALEATSCLLCGGKGYYMYDHNHSKPCEACCEHAKGWWDLADHHAGFIAGADNGCCRAGCGQLRRDAKLDHGEQTASDPSSPNP